jgi:hypothetical protein
MQKNIPTEGLDDELKIVPNIYEISIFVSEEAITPLWEYFAAMSP